MTIPSLRSLIFEVKSTGSKLAFIFVLRLRKTLDVFGRLWTSSEDIGLFRESPEMIVSPSKILVLQGKKSRAYISEKVGRYRVMAALLSHIILSQIHVMLQTPKRIAMEIVKCIITWKKINFADLAKDAKSITGFPLLNFESNRVTSLKHGLCAKTVSKWQPSKLLIFQDEFLQDSRHLRSWNFDNWKSQLFEVIFSFNTDL